MLQRGTSWRIVTPGDGPKPALLADPVHMKCNHALSHRDLGMVDRATHTFVVDGWYLYTSHAPHEDYHPFRKSGNLAGAGA